MSEQAAPMYSDALVEHLLITEHQGCRDLVLLKRLQESEQKPFVTGIYL